MRLVILVFIFFCFSCGKKAKNADINYIGSWSTDLDCVSRGGVFSSLSIDNKSNGDYFEVDCNSEECEERAKGKVRIRGGKMRIGLVKKLTIVQQPAEFDTINCPTLGTQSFWKMRLYDNYNYMTYYRPRI